MGILEIFLTGVGLSMDAFAAAVCKGLGMRRLSVRNALVIALFFGGFQALMPLIGWVLGSQFEHIITPIDHWIAFVLLAFIGGKMLRDAFAGDDSEEPGAAASACACEAADASERLDLREVAMLAVATSIDALAVGITMAFLRVDIALAVALIGVTTFVLSFAGVVAGNKFGARYEKPATITGGVVLILIGLKILLEHLGILAL